MTEQTTKKEIALSASAIKAIDTCSWMYWQQYLLKVPQAANPATSRGTIVHLILEILLNPRHKHHYDKVVSDNSIKACKPIYKLLIKQLLKYKIFDYENVSLCDKMILVGLNADYFCKGGTLGEPEFRFELKSENPKYFVRGFIDKLATYPDGKIKILDYKTSKQKFSKEELASNFQSLVYSLVGYKILKAKDVDTEFLFLRFDKNPSQQVKMTKSQLNGFEHYLAYLYDLINNFDESKAKSNFAAKDKKHCWMCQAGKWKCPYKEPFQYHALIDDKTGAIARTAILKEDLKPEPNQTYKVMQYDGCPYWNNEKKGL